MSARKRQLEILEFLGCNTTSTKSQIRLGLNWSNPHLTKLLIQDLVDQNLVFHDGNPDMSSAKFSLTLQGFQTLKEFGG